MTSARYLNHQMLTIVFSMVKTFGKLTRFFMVRLTFARNWPSVVPDRVKRRPKKPIKASL